MLLSKKIRSLLRKIPGARKLYGIIRRKSILFKLFGKLVDATYIMDGIITTANCDFMKDPEFIKARKSGDNHEEISNAGYWTRHIQLWAVSYAKNLKGDFIECGVNRGGGAIATMIYIDFKSLKNRTYYLFDTFNGLDKEFSTEEEYLTYEGVYPDCYEEVKNIFKDYSNVVIVKGPVPTTLSKVDIQKVAYLHIDMNSALPEKEAIKYFWPKLESGGIILFDDYGRPGHENQKKVADDFALSVNAKILSLPTGQGLMIKLL